MEKEQFIPQELFEHYDIKLFDINRTDNVYKLILKMWNENKELRERKTYEEGIVKGFSHNIKTIEELEEQIKKAIAYLKENECENIYLDCKLYETKLYNELLEILKGNEK